MSDKNALVRVLLVDDSYLVRQSIKAMLEFEAGEFTVVGEAANGLEAVEQTGRLHPDVVLMDVNMPDMDGISATVKIMEQNPVGVVIISVQGEQDYLRRAMKAGARDYLLKPFTCEELVNALRSAARKGPNPLAVLQPAPPKAAGKVITVFSSKGGVGKTTLVSNLAVGLALNGKLSVAAVDLDLEFGVLASMMGVRPKGSLIDLCRLDATITPEQAGHVVARQKESGVDVLAAPPLPHLASEVDGDGRADRSRNYVVEMIEALRATHDYVLIDTSVGFREANLIALDKSDLILMVTLPEVPTLETTAKGLDVLLERLEYPREKVRLVLNQADSSSLSQAEITASLGVPFSYLIPTDSKAASTAANTGIPMIQMRTRTPVVDTLLKIADHIASGEKNPLNQESAAPVPAPAPRRLFGLLGAAK